MELTFQNFEHGMTYTHTDIGGFLGQGLVDRRNFTSEGRQAIADEQEANRKKAKEEAKRKAKEQKDTGAKSDNPASKDPFQFIEDALAGVYESIIGGLSKVGQGLEAIGGGMVAGAMALYQTASTAVASWTQDEPAPDAEPTPAQVRMKKDQAQYLVFAKARNEATAKGMNDKEAAAVGRKAKNEFMDSNEGDTVSVDLSTYNENDMKLAKDSFAFVLKNPNYDYGNDPRWGNAPSHTDTPQINFNPNLPAFMQDPAYNASIGGAAERLLEEMKNPGMNREKYSAQDMIDMGFAEGDVPDDVLHDCGGINPRTGEYIGKGMVLAGISLVAPYLLSGVIGGTAAGFTTSGIVNATSYAMFDDDPSVSGTAINFGEGLLMHGIAKFFAGVKGFNPMKKIVGAGTTALGINYGTQKFENYVDDQPMDNISMWRLTMASLGVMGGTALEMLPAGTPNVHLTTRGDLFMKDMGFSLAYTAPYSATVGVMGKYVLPEVMPQRKNSTSRNTRRSRRNVYGDYYDGTLY